MPTPPKTAFTTSTVRIGNWQEDEAWRGSARHAVPASDAARGFGSRSGSRTAEQELARGGGHASSAITDFGYAQDWSRAPVEAAPPSRRGTCAGSVDQASSEGIRQSVFNVGVQTAAELQAAAAAGGTTPRLHKPWAVDDDERPAPNETYRSISGVPVCKKGGEHAGRYPTSRVSEDSPFNHAAIAAELARPPPQAAFAPSTPPPLAIGDGARPLDPRVADVLRAFAVALADRKLDVVRAFANYDPRRTGVVSESDAASLMRSMGISPFAGFADYLPPAAAAPGGVRYAALPALLPAAAPTGLTSVGGEAPMSSRRHMPAAAPTPSIIEHANGGAAPSTAAAPPTPRGAGPALHRQLAYRLQQLGRTSADLWSCMRPVNGVVDEPSLNAGLHTVGIELGSDDFHALFEHLTASSPSQRVVTWEAWSQLFSKATDDGGKWTEASAAERRQRLVYQRLLGSIKFALGDDASAILQWYDRKDVQRLGRVPIETFTAGLRRHGVQISDPDAMLAASALDPEGGGHAVAYGRLATLSESRAAGAAFP